MFKCFHEDQRDHDIFKPILPYPSSHTTFSRLSRFFNLAYLWLNDNLLTRVPPLTKNCHLTEVYLHNNRLTTVSGVFKRLFCLQTLFLHNNQLRNLDETIRELQPLKALRILNLFHNPLAQEEKYREKVRNVSCREIFYGIFLILRILHRTVTQHTLKMGQKYSAVP